MAPLSFVPSRHGRARSGPACSCMANTQHIGNRAEDLAADYLRRRGYRILHRNWRFHHKELDLIAEREGVVAFVEVKARAENGWGHALEAITARKRRDLAVAARGWIAEHGAPFSAFRFDAVTVVNAPSQTRVEHIEDAWRM